MIVTHLNARNWRNFRRIDVDLRERQFIVGPNASGKSNFLDVFRFLRDIAKSEGGGLHRVQKSRRRQVIVSTHSDDLLNERGIDGREVLMLLPGAEGTEVTVASDIADVRALLEAGFTAGEVILPRTNPPQTTQLSLLD